MKQRIPYLVERPGTDGPLYFWQPSTALRKAGWGPVNYQKPVDTANGAVILDSLGAIIDHAKARNAAVKGAASTAPAKLKQVVTLNTWMDEFERDTRYYLRLSSASQRQYRNNFKILRPWAGDRVPGSISADDVLALFDALHQGRGLATANAVVTSLKRLFNWAPVRRLAVQGMPNPAAGLKLPKAPARSIRWEDDEIAAFVELADKGSDRLDPNPTMGTAVTMAYYLGQRKGDMLRMTPAMTSMIRARIGGVVHTRPGIILLTEKTGEKVGVPFHTVLRDRLGTYDPDSLIPFLTTTTGKLFKARWFNSQFERIRAEMVRQGWDVGHKTIHDLRRTTVVKLAEMGIEAEIIRAITRHSLKTINDMLETYLVRSNVMTMSAVLRWEAAG